MHANRHDPSSPARIVVAYKIVIKYTSKQFLPCLLTFEAILYAFYFVSIIILKKLSIHSMLMILYYTFL